VEDVGARAGPTIWQPVCDRPGVPNDRRLPVHTSNYDDATIAKWRLEPQLTAADIDDTQYDQAPPLWKDLALASIVAVLMWMGAAAIFG
jgi:hypothetical protein